MLDLLCAGCGAPCQPGQRLCASCGGQLSGPSEDGGGQEERRIVAVLFADLEGYTALAEKLDPEDLRAVQGAYFDLVTRVVHRRQGVVEKYVGDAVMAVFGAPRTREDDALRAVRAAVEIQESLTGHRLGPVERIGARVAVASGEAVVDLAAMRDGGQALLSGEVVSTAARLQQFAPAGQVVVTEQVQEACGDSVQFADLGSVVLRGRSAPVRYARAVRLLRPRRWDLRPDEGQMIGRADELERLLRAVVDAASRREPARLTVLGEPGMGKSRLLRELYRRVDALAAITVTWRTGQCPPLGEGGPYDALAEILAEEARVTDTSDPAAVREALRVMAGRLVTPTEQPGLVEAGAALLGVPGSRLTAAEAENAWRSLLLALARHQPTMLVIEDAHWAHQVLLGFLDRLVAEATGLPLVVLVTARPELLDDRADTDRADTDRADTDQADTDQADTDQADTDRADTERADTDRADTDRAGVLRLAPLSDDETAALLRMLFGRITPERSTLQALLPVAAGNPLYAHEYVRMIVERCEIQRSEAAAGTGAATLVGAGPPGSVRAVITSRLDLLEVRVRRVLSAAATIGETFWPEAVAAVAGQPAAEVRAVLDDLVGKDLLRRVATSSVPGEPEFAFRHVLVREMAYRRLPRDRRSRGHRRTAEWLESRSDRVREDFAERLAHHRTITLDLARTLGHDTVELIPATRRALVAAARRSRHQHAAVVALRHLDRAMSLWPDEPGAVADARAERLDAVVLRAEMQFLVDPRGFRGGTGPAELTEAVEELDSLGRRDRAAYALTLLGHTHWTGGDLANGRAALGRALDLFDRLPDSESAATAYAEMARLALAESDLSTAVVTAGRASRIAADLGLLELEASSRTSAGAARYMMGQDSGITELEEAVEFSREHGVYALRRAEYVLGVVLQEDGDLRRGLALIDRSEQVGGAGTSATLAAVSHEAERSYYAGDLPRLLRAAAQYLAGVADGDVDLEALQLQALCSWVRVLRDEPPGVGLPQLLELAHRGGSRLAVARTLAHGALCQALSGNTRAAGDWLDRLIDEGADRMFLSRDWLPAAAHAAALAGPRWCGWFSRVLAAEPRRSGWVRAARLVVEAGNAVHADERSAAATAWAAAAVRYDEIGSATDAALAATWAARWAAAPEDEPLLRRVENFARSTGAHRLLVIARSESVEAVAGLVAARDGQTGATQATAAAR
jgi:class 3 adenylate cyclase